MNQQLIFNHDFSLDPVSGLIHCSVLWSGLRINVMLRCPKGIAPTTWLAQVKDDAFNWEDKIEHALQTSGIDDDGVLWLDGVAESVDDNDYSA